MTHATTLETGLGRPGRAGHGHKASRQARHRLPACSYTGLPRYRDRHQARQAARARSAGEQPFKVAVFGCPDCRGFHLELMPQPSQHHTTSVAETREPRRENRSRRYVLIDLENLTQGGKANPEEVVGLWRAMGEQLALDLDDHVVIGTSRGIAGKYRGTIHGPNVKWVVGADAPDGADHALLAAIDLHRVARHYEELLIASGDHAFAGLARQAHAKGLKVEVITTDRPGRRRALSRALAVQADRQTCLGPFPPASPSPQAYPTPVTSSQGMPVPTRPRGERPGTWAA